MQKGSKDLRTILLLIGGAAGGLCGLTIAGSILLNTGFLAFTHTLSQKSPSPVEDLVLASGIAFGGMLLLPAAYFSLQRLLGKQISPGSPRPLKIWQSLFLLLLWIGDAFLAQILFNNNILRWLTPPCYLLAIVLPVYFSVRLAAGGLKAGSLQRFWGVLTTSMVLGVSLSILAEGMAVLLGFIGIGIYLGLHPGLLPFFTQSAEQLSSPSSLDHLLSLAQPWLLNPLTVLAVLFFFSGLTPLIEEIAKTIATWTIFDHLETTAQGFVVGVLSGAGFGVLESLLASAQPDANWAATLLIRGGSTMMHIVTASLTGWGIASFRVNRSIGRMLGMYALAIFLHGLWNACVVLIVLGGFHIAVGKGGPDFMGIGLAGLGVAVLIVLLLSLPLILGIANAKFRSITSAPTPALSPLPETPRA
jgi:RsiW-degrading membrane proteinase PrsW (M82 family)